MKASECGNTLQNDSMQALHEALLDKWNFQKYLLDEDERLAPCIPSAVNPPKDAVAG